MVKDYIKVPPGIRFISDWNEFNIPNFPCIIDKKIPGCGFTEYCISNPENIILCSPRKLLLENKENQHPNELLYIKNELDQDETVDKDLEKITKSSENIPTKFVDLTSEDNRKIIINNLKTQIQQYVNLCLNQGKPIKILVTYDSFRLVKESLGDYISNFRVVVDEFQSIFTDSRFKATTELEFINHLRSLDRVCFVSATPMIDDYLEKIDIFKDLPYFELDWVSRDPLRVLKPDLIDKPCRSVNEPAYNIIEKYLSGDFDSVSYRDSFGNIQTIYSKEAVFYVNSVSNILGIINKCGLKPEQCNILIARTPDNEKKIKSRLGKKWEIGSIPLKGEPHKMFTFCTRTVYLGADFYSTNARTFIFSDANIETLSVDISLDLPQILGRQRNLENPWKNKAEFYYKTTKSAKTKEEFEKYLKEKEDRTLSLLKAYNSEDLSSSDRKHLAEEYQRMARTFNYRNHYIAVNKHSGQDIVPVFNDLVKIAEKRSFDIQQIDYKDRFSVFNTLKSINIVQDSVIDFLSKFNSFTQFTDKMKFLCENELNPSELEVILNQLPALYRTYYSTLGPALCKALKYRKGELDKEFLLQKNGSFNTMSLKDSIYSLFTEGEIYTKRYIKDSLGELYKALSYGKTPKATDLAEFFEIKECKKRVDSKLVECFKIVAKL